MLYVCWCLMCRSATKDLVQGPRSYSRWSDGALTRPSTSDGHVGVKHEALNVFMRHSEQLIRRPCDPDECILTPTMLIRCNMFIAVCLILI